MAEKIMWTISPLPKARATKEEEENLEVVLAWNSGNVQRVYHHGRKWEIMDSDCS